MKIRRQEKSWKAFKASNIIFTLKNKTMKAKSLIATIAFLLLSITNYAFSSEGFLLVTPDDSTEIKNIQNTVVEAYVDGIFLQGNANLVKKGWHPDCDIVILENGNIAKLPAKYWVDRFEKNPKPLDPRVTYKFVDVKVTGYAAIAIIEIFSNGKQIYTDYMCLYKFDDGWKIVTKIFYAFPRK
ncbi:MAG: hypothetical protein ACD_79C01463G0001 [uncultured bacterium]|nr:MAG: hypothetical protein ACD_79C01463G0001 [uncultured bacterium]